MTNKKGICEKSKKGDRERHHTMEQKTDMYGNTYRTCKECGSTPVVCVRKNQENKIDQAIDKLMDEW